jgi:palmitoyltransferase
MVSITRETPAVAGRWWEGRGALQLDKESAAAAVLITSTILMSSQGFLWTILGLFTFFPILGISLKLGLSRFRGTHFYISWAISSFVLLVYVFEFQVVPYLEIYLYENVTVLLLTASALVCAILVRRDSLHLARRGSPPPSSVSPSEEYISWLNCVVDPNNRLHYAKGLLFAALALVYESHLTMTTICHPVLVYNTVLVPDDCSDVYGDFHVSLCFVSAVYALELAGFCTIHSMAQFWKHCSRRTHHQFTELKRNEC